MKTVYLHIGNFKTGTSAIQKYCSENRKQLQEQGLRYLQSGVSKSAPESHASIPLSYLSEADKYTPPWYMEDIAPTKLMTDVRHEIEHCDSKSVLISSEEFYRWATIAPESTQSILTRFRENLAGFNVRVIMYVRDPMAFMKSWYNQANKAYKPVPTFSDFVENLAPPLVLPNINAQLWRNYFGDDCLILKPYYGLSGTHITDFLAIIGTESMHGIDSTYSDINPGRSEIQLERDRISKIFALVSKDRRDTFLSSQCLASDSRRSKLEKRLSWINDEFSAFCARECLNFPESNASLEAIIDHEQRINPHHIIQISLKTWIQAKAYNSPMRVFGKYFRHALRHG